MKRHSPVFCLLVIACVCLFASGCATMQDVDSLRADVNRLLKDSYAAKSEIEILKERTAGVAKEESFNVVRMSQAEIQAQLATLAGDIQKLNGRVDENRYFLEKSVKESAGEVDLLKAQVSALEKQIRDVRERIVMLEGLLGQRRDVSGQEQVKSPDKKAVDGTAEAETGEKKAVSEPVADTATQQYEGAYSAFQKKHYKEAREKFEAFLKAFPKDERVDNAYFWIAETYFQEKDYEEAILAYETHLKKFPKSQKAPTSLLKQGLSFIELGDNKTGVVILEQVIERYPKSNEAALAKKQVEKVKKTKK